MNCISFAFTESPLLKDTLILSPLHFFEGHKIYMKFNMAYYVKYNLGLYYINSYPAHKNLHDTFWDSVLKKISGSSEKLVYIYILAQYYKLHNYTMFVVSWIPTPAFWKLRAKSEHQSHNVYNMLTLLIIWHLSIWNIFSFF